ncbi:MAG: polymerase subunit beta [Chloroflexia bacterium]|jgi:DNA polymerase-3 subunit beta|nr:polymerase subunit beta [Chloroflexia bacterium]
MKVSCLQENLHKGLQTVGKAVANKTTLPVLNNILLQTDGGRLKLTATNLEVGITHWTGCQVEEEGAITVPARLLIDFVSSLPNDRISMTLDEKTRTLNLKCARYEANIKGISAEEFPIIPEVTETPIARIPAPLLKEMVGQVAFAASGDDSRPQLSGVFVQIEGREMIMAAADGFRLARKVVQIGTPVEHSIKLIIPARSMVELARALPDDEGEEAEPVSIVVTPNRNQVLFRHDNLEVTSRLVDGNYVDINRVIPADWGTRTVMATADLVKAVRIASMFAKDSANIVRLQVEPGNDLTPGVVTISANAAEVGDNVSQLDCTVDGEGGQIALNGKYLLDVLNVLNTGQVALETKTYQSPAVVKPVGEDGYLHVVMPMYLPNR